MGIIKKIKGWFNNRINFYYLMFIMLIIIMVTLSFAEKEDTKNIQIDCTEKCEELGYEYFDSERENLFKGEDCKCKDNDNNLIDIK